MSVLNCTSSLQAGRLSLGKGRRIAVPLHSTLRYLGLGSAAAAAGMANSTAERAENKPSMCRQKPDARALASSRAALAPSHPCPSLLLPKGLGSSRLHASTQRGEREMHFHGAREPARGYGFCLCMSAVVLQADTSNSSHGTWSGSGGEKKFTLRDFCCHLSLVM